MGERFRSLPELKLKGQQGGAWPRFGQVKLAGLLSRFIGGAERLGRSLRGQGVAFGEVCFWHVPDTNGVTHESYLSLLGWELFKLWLFPG